MAKRPKVDPRDDAYYAALGRFISEFAQVEAILAHLLRMEAGVDSPIAEAVFSGVRIDQAKSLITRVREAKGGALDPPIKRAFDQLTLITNARNAIVHYATSVTDGADVWITNLMAAHKPSRLQMTLVSRQVLEAMTRDLHTIHAALMLPLLEDMFTDRSGTRPRRRLPAEMRQMFERNALEPFRYKPAEPTPTLKRRQSKHLGPPPRRRSSRPKPQP